MPEQPIQPPAPLDDLDNYFVAHIYLPDPESRTGWVKLAALHPEQPKPKLQKLAGLR